VPGEALTTLKARVERRVGLRIPGRLRSHFWLLEELRRQTREGGGGGIDVAPRQLIPESVLRTLDPERWRVAAHYNEIVRLHWETIGAERARKRRKNSI
jgi:hypothetical protein